MSGADRSEAPTAPAWLGRVLGPFVRAWLRLEVAGGRHVPSTGGVILAPSHGSFADPVAVGAATPRPLTYLASAHLTDHPLSGRLLRVLGVLSVQRGDADLGALERCAAALGAGGALVVFPEGGRSRDGRVYRPRSGVARLAARTGCPVVPVGIRGAARAWPVGAWPRLPGGSVRVRFGAPLDPPADEPGDRRDFTELLHSRLVDLTGAPRGDGFLHREAA